MVTGREVTRAAEEEEEPWSQASKSSEPLRYIRNPESAFTPKRKSLVNLTPTLPSQITENLKEEEEEWMKELVVEVVLKEIKWKKKQEAKWFEKYSSLGLFFVLFLLF